MLVAIDLAEKLHKSVTALDKDNNKSSITEQTIKFATGVVTMLSSATFSHMLVTGNGVPEGSFIGVASSGKLLNVMPNPIISNFPADCNPQYTLSTSAILSEYLMTKSVINFTEVTGMCTATSKTPGALATGSATNGKLIGLNGNDLASKIQATFAMESTETLKTFYQTLCDYIMKNITLNYLPGTINGGFSAGGGPLIGGTGIQGVIS